MAPDGNHFNTLYSFTGGADGEFPYGSVVRDKDGTLYGTAAETLGCYNCDQNGRGTVWQLKRNGTFAVLHSFAGGKDRANPQGNLLKIGNALYGTTQWGGGSGCSGSGGSGCGAVYKLALKMGGKYKILHRFADGTGDGQHPLAGLGQGPDGTLYARRIRVASTTGEPCLR